MKRERDGKYLVRFAGIRPGWNFSTWNELRSEQKYLRNCTDIRSLILDNQQLFFNLRLMSPNLNSFFYYR